MSGALSMLLAVTTRIYFPVVACIIASIVGTVLLNIYLRRR
jgi:hypothetical protein